MEKDSKKKEEQKAGTGDQVKKTEKVTEDKGKASTATKQTNETKGKPVEKPNEDQGVKPKGKASDKKRLAEAIGVLVVAGGLFGGGLAVGSHNSNEHSTANKTAKVTDSSSKKDASASSSSKGKAKDQLTDTAFKKGRKARIKQVKSETTLTKDSSGKVVVNGKDPQYYKDMTKVQISDLQKALLGKQSFILYVGRPTCPDCRNFLPVISKVLAQNKLHAYYLDTDTAKTVPNKLDYEHYLAFMANTHTSTVPNVMRFIYKGQDKNGHSTFTFVHYDTTNLSNKDKGAGSLQHFLTKTSVTNGD